MHGSATASRFIDGLGAVSVIGAGINATYANVRAGLAALRRCGRRIARHVDVVVPDHVDGAERRRRDAVRALHARFIEGTSPPVP